MWVAGVKKNELSNSIDKLEICTTNKINPKANIRRIEVVFQTHCFIKWKVHDDFEMSKMDVSDSMIFYSYLLPASNSSTAAV